MPSPNSCRQQPPNDYSAGWRDGCQYGEGLARWKGRIEGTFGGLILACAIAALVYFIGGR